MCSNVLGCPHALVVRSQEGYVALWSGFVPGPGVVMSSRNKGYHDLAFSNQLGYLALRFDGTHYQVVQTSYPSLVTPAP